MGIQTRCYGWVGTELLSRWQLPWVVSPPLSSPGPVPSFAPTAYRSLPALAAPRADFPDPLPIPPHF